MQYTLGKNSMINPQALVDLYGTDNFYPVYDKFSGLDSESNFKINLVNQPTDWIYRTKEVRYTLNSQHYRCESFDKIDWSNSILIFGCSITFGVGVDDEDTISARLQQHTNFKVINLGAGASSQQFSLYNNILLKNNNIKPKAIIHLWTDSFRTFTVDEHYNIIHNGPWNNFGFPENTPPEFLNSLFGESKTQAVSAVFNRMTVNSLYNDIPVIHATHSKKMWEEQNLKYPNFPMLFLPLLDYARDLQHPGIKSNIHAAELLQKKLNLVPT